MVKPLFLLPAVLIFGCAASVSAAAFQEDAKNGDASSHAKQIYTVDCAICHGANGDGKTDLAKDMSLILSDFTDPKTLAGKTDKELFDLIRKGKDKMPPEEANRAKDSDVRGLIQYIRGMSKGGHSPAATPAEEPATPPTPPGKQ